MHGPWSWCLLGSTEAQIASFGLQPFHTELRSWGMTRGMSFDSGAKFAPPAPAFSNGVFGSPGRCRPCDSRVKTINNNHLVSLLKSNLFSHRFNGRFLHFSDTISPTLISSLWLGTQPRPGSEPEITPTALRAGRCMCMTPPCARAAQRP